AITAPTRNGSQGAKERALHRRRRRAEHDHVAELLSEQRELQWMRHAFAIRVAEPGETVCGLNHVGEALARRHLNTNAGVLAVARVPPVVPHTRLDDGRLALTEDSRLPGELHGELTLKHGEALNESGMAVLADDPRSNERCQLSSRAALWVLPGKLENRGSLAGDRVFPDLTDLDRGAVRWSVRIGMRHTRLLNATVPLSRIRM